MKKIACAVLIALLPMAASWATGAWETQGRYYFLTKNTRDYFSAPAAGANRFAGKYLTREGVDFLVRGADGWKSITCFPCRYVPG